MCPGHGDVSELGGRRGGSLPDASPGSDHARQDGRSTPGLRGGDTGRAEIRPPGYGGGISGNAQRPRVTAGNVPPDLRAVSTGSFGSDPSEHEEGYPVLVVVGIRRRDRRSP